MASQRVVVAGTDDEALLVAGRLTLAGHEVVLLRSAADAPWPGGADVAAGVRLRTPGGDRDLALAGVTSDPFEALAGCDAVLSCAPPHRLDTVTSLVLPLLEPGHVLVFLPGRLCSLAGAAWLRGRGRVDLPALVECDVAPFAGRRLVDGRLDLLSEAALPGFGVFPGGRASQAWPVLAELFPGAHLHPHVVAAALAAPQPFLRAAAGVVNAGAAGEPGDAAIPLGFTPGVARLAGLLDRERLALARTLDLELPAAPDMLHRWGLAPLGDLWAAVNGSFVLAHATLGEGPPGAHLRDDLVFCLRPWIELATHLGVPMPLASSLLTVFEALAAEEGGGWSLDDLGLAGLDAGGLLGYLESGRRDEDS
jgi:hypothetical protein